MAYEIYQKVGGTFVPLQLTTDQRLSNVETTCLDYEKNGVKHSAQGLTEGQKTQARANIGAAKEDEVVKSVAQSLTPTQQDRVLENLGILGALRTLITEYGGSVPQ